LETPKLCIFIFCVSSTAVGFRELWWFMTWSMLAEPKSLVFTFASWVDQGEEFTELTHKPSRFHKMVASPVQPFHFGSKSQGPLPDAVFSCVFGVSTRNGDSLGEMN
jgi:hypothetical protein